MLKKLRLLIDADIEFHISAKLEVHVSVTRRKERQGQRLLDMSRHQVLDLTSDLSDELDDIALKKNDDEESA